MFYYVSFTGRMLRPALLCCALTLTVKGAPPVIEFLEIPDDRIVESVDGTVTLSWPEPTEGREVELQQSSTENFTDPLERYRGGDAGSVVTGLAEGEHYFRVRAVNANGVASAWSEPVQVEVTFMDRSRLFLLLSLGGLVVAMTICTIIAGYVSHRGRAIERNVE